MHDASVPKSLFLNLVAGGIISSLTNLENFASYLKDLILSQLPFVHLLSHILLSVETSQTRLAE